VRVTVLMITAAMVLGLLVSLAGRSEAHTGAWIDSPFTSSPPTTDGTLGPGEWSDAATVDLGAIPGNNLPAFLLTKNDGTFLYVAYDAVGDTTSDPFDSASVAFDTGHDLSMSFGGEDQFFWGGFAMNGEEHLVSDGSFWFTEDSPFNTGLPNHAGLASGTGFGPSDLDANPHRTFELAIPLALIGVVPGDVIGFLGASQPMPGVVDGTTFAYSTWPDFLFGPPPLDKYGDLRFGQPGLLNDLDINPPSNTILASPLSSAFYTFTVVNQGTALDTFDLTVTSGWPPTLLLTDGITPLPDTDGDLVQQRRDAVAGGTADFMVRVDVPLTIGCDDAVLVGTSSNDVGVSDDAVAHTCVSTASLNPPHSDTGLDTDLPPNGLFDELDIDVGILVNVDGTYLVEVALFDISLSTFITYGFVPAFLISGSTFVTVPLSGSDIFLSGIDGPYVALINLYDDTFTLLDTGTHTTAPYLFTDFDPPAAMFNPPHSDAGVDTDVPPNGLFDFLEVNAAVTVNESGSFIISAVLVDPSFSFITFTTTTATLGVGDQVVPLDFLGREIFTSGLDGPYTAFMDLYDASFVFLDSDSHTTGMYLAADFDPPPAAFSPPHSDGGVDLTLPPDGLFEFLEVGASVNVVEAGTFTVSALLWDATQTFAIASAQATSTLGVGLGQIPVRFSGIAIAASGFDGPYVADLTLTDALGFLDLGVHMTGAYTATQFAGPGASLAPPHSDGLVDADSPPDGLADWLAIDVEVNVLVPGPYELSGALVDMGGRPLAFDTDCGVLAAGPATCTLLFDGHAIERTGANGPYFANLALYDGYGRFLDAGTHVTAAYTSSAFEPADGAPPSASATAVPYWINRAPLVMGFTASDPAPTDGLQSVTLWYRHSTDNASWTPWTSFLTVAATGASASGFVPFSFPSGIGFYEFQFTAEDVSGNVESAGAAERGAVFRPLGSLAFVPSTVPVAAGTQSTVQVQVLGPDGQPARLQSPLIVNLATASSSGEFRTVGTSTAITSVAIAAGQFSASVDYYDDAAGTWPIRASSVSIADGIGTAVVSAGTSAAVTISPATATVTVGGTFGFSAQAWDAFGNAIPEAFSWSASAAIGSISGAGVLTAATQVASGTVTASVVGNPALQASASVSLVAGPAASVVISPNTATVQVGGSLQFLAEARDAFGNAVAHAFTWSATAAIGGVSSAGLLSAANIVASGVVTAALAGNPGIFATASVSLLPGPAATVTVAPPTATLTPDGTQTFTATVEDAFGNVISTTPTWSTTGGIGTVDGAGAFTAGRTAGAGSVAATAGSVQGTAAVTVNPGAPARVVVTPPSAVADVATAVAMSGQVVDQYGNAVSGSTIVWSVTGGIGTITSAGLFTAGQTPGTGEVVATVGAIDGRAGVTVVPGAASAVRISPPSATIQYGTSVDLQASVVDQFGNEIEGAAITWSVSGPGSLSATTGTTTRLNGTAGGTVTVTATSGARSVTATFTMIGPPTTPAEPSNVTPVAIGGILGGLVLGTGLGWLIRGRGRGPPRSDDKEDEEPGEDEEEDLGEDQEEESPPRKSKSK